jgi:RNA polymerase sigma factor for flagellar operon FliA
MDLLTAHLPLIDRLLASVCRRNGFPAAESEEFAAWAKLKLIEDDDAVFRKFRGESSLPTYLAAVVANLFRDYRIHRWGKWRPSAEARRLGESAVALERLVARDGRSLEEAVAIVLGECAARGEARSATELRELGARLPARTKRRFESDEGLERLPGGAPSDERLLDGERRALARRAEEELARAVAELDAEERLILKLRFADGMAIVDIAALLGVPPKPLYARIERTLGTLRREFERRGLEGRELAELVGWSGLDLRFDFGVGAESGGGGPSHQEEQRA